MVQPKYATAVERKAALSEKAKRQMQAQWERQREETGQPLGYFGCHRRVRTQRGRAADQTCECGKRARHWAHIHGTDPSDVQNYKPMCQSCHYRYDRVRPQGAETLGPAGRSAAAELAWSRRTPEERRQIALKAWETKRRRNAGLPDVVVPDIPRDGG
jgi:hypothetical protein